MQLRFFRKTVIAKGQSQGCSYLVDREEISGFAEVISSRRWGCRIHSSTHLCHKCSLNSPLSQAFMLATKVTQPKSDQSLLTTNPLNNLVVPLIILPSVMTVSNWSVPLITNLPLQFDLWVWLVYPGIFIVSSTIPPSGCLPNHINLHDWLITLYIFSLYQFTIYT